MAEQKLEKTKEEISRKNRNFFVSAGTIFLTVFIAGFWLFNLPYVFKSSLGEINEAPKEKTDLTQVRRDLDKIMTGVGEKFEKINQKKSESQEAVVLLNKIAEVASSSLEASSTLIIGSSSDLLIDQEIKPTTSVKILK